MKNRQAGRVALAGLAIAAVVGGTFATTVAAEAKPGRDAPSVSEVKPAPKVTMDSKMIKVVKPSSALVQKLTADGNCEVGEVCLYYNTAAAGWGSSSDTGHNDPYLLNNHFNGVGAGKGAIVGNNSRAVWNRDNFVHVKLCTGPNYTGTCGWVNPNTFGTLNTPYYDNVESLLWNDVAN